MKHATKLIKITTMGQSPSQPEQAAASSPSEELRNHLLLIRPTLSLEKLDALIQEFNENSTDPMIYEDRETRFPGRTEPFMDRLQFTECLFRHGVSNNDELLNQLFKIFDRNNEGVVNVKEFINASVLFLDATKEEKLKMQFNLFDLDRTGYITKGDTKRILRYHLPAPYCDVLRHFDDIDSNHDGKISFEDFKRALKDVDDVDYTFTFLRHVDLDLAKRPSFATLQGRDEQEFVSEPISRADAIEDTINKLKREAEDPSRRQPTGFSFFADDQIGK